jgi:hypothetical protein
MAIPAAAFAGTFCEPSAQQLREQVSYCDENFAYIDPAKACRDRYMAAVKKEEAEIRKILATDLSKAPASSQKTEFGTSQKVLQSADKMLSDLIRKGKGVYTELEDYTFDLVPPIYEEIPGDLSLDIDDPGVQKDLREEECYGTPMEELDQVKSDLQETIESLERTERKVASLHEQSKAGEVHLDKILDAVGAQAFARKAVSVKMGRSKNGASDVTGLAKEEKLAAVGSAAKLKQPDFPAGGSAKATSGITARGAPGGSHSPGDPVTDVFVSSSQLAPVAPLGGAARKSAAVPESVGSALWGQSEKSSRSFELTVGGKGYGEERSTSSVSSGSESLPAGGGGDYQSEYGRGDKAEESAPQGGNVERSLFALVRERYRASDLFRNARMGLEK